MMNHDTQLDRMFQALADTNRRQLIDQLAQGPASVSDLARPLPISLPAVLQHLAVLQDCGLVTTEKVGRVRTCTLDTGALSRAETWIHERRLLWTQRLDALARHLDQQKDFKP